MPRLPVPGSARMRDKARKSPSFPKGEKDIDIEAAALMNALCKPWELGGHPRDFLVAHRSARITDTAQHYERDKALIKRHERMVAEKVTWNRQRAIKEEMLQLLTTLHSIEKQRRHFNAVRLRSRSSQDPPTRSMVELARHASHVDEHDAKANTQILSATFVNDSFHYAYPDCCPRHRPGSRSSTRSQSLMAVDQDGDLTTQAVISPLTVVERKAVRDLDTFEEQVLASNPTRGPLPGSAASFGKARRK